MGMQPYCIGCAWCYLRNAANFLAFPHQLVADDVEPMLLTRRVAIEMDARTFDTPLRAFAPADDQLAVCAELEAESVAFPLCSDQRALIQRARVDHRLRFGKAALRRSR